MIANYIIYDLLFNNLMSAAQRKQQSNDLAEQRLRDRIRQFVTDLKNPEDIVVSLI